MKTRSWTVLFSICFAVLLMPHVWDAHLQPSFYIAFPAATFTPVLPMSTVTSTLASTPIPTATFFPSITPASTSTDIPTTIPTPSVISSFSSNLDGWTVRGDGGSWNYANDGLVGTVANGTDSFYVADTSETDFTYETTFTISTGNSTAAAGIIFRSRPDPLQGCYMVRVSVYNGGEISLIKFFPLRQYQQLALKNLSINLESLYRLIVIANGTQIQVYLNSELVLQADDSSYEGGTIGLNINSGTAIFTSANTRPS